MGVALKFARWAETRMPGVALALAAPAVSGLESTDTPQGTAWQAQAARPTFLVICVSDAPADAKWLAGSLARRLDAVVLVARGDTDVAAIVECAVKLIASRGLDPTRTAVIGEGAGGEAALAACRLIPTSRLALLYPPPMPGLNPAGVPTTLLQASGTGEHRGDMVAIDVALRIAGIAVRETDYQSIADGWARYPRLIRHSARALDDLVGFLERGVGAKSSFDVIPGWDLH